MLVCRGYLSRPEFKGIKTVRHHRRLGNASIYHALNSKGLRQGQQLCLVVIRRIYHALNSKGLRPAIVLHTMQAYGIYHALNSKGLRLEAELRLRRSR